MRASLVLALVLMSQSALAQPAAGDPADEVIENNETETETDPAPPSDDVTGPPRTSGGLRHLGGFVASGKAELLVTSALFGGYSAELALLSAGFFLGNHLQLSVPWELQGLVASTVFLAPIAGGAAGLTAAALGVALWPGMTAGDAHLLRTSLFLATFNSAAAGILTNVYGEQGVTDWWRHRGSLTTSAMLGASLGTTALAAALAAVTDLPEGAGPLALSAATWSAVLATLGQLMFDLPLDLDHGTWLVAGVANASFGTALLASPWLPLTRFETWLLDLGAVAGGLLGTALVLGLPAPNPVLGYGGIATGVVLGAGAGVAVGKLVPLGLDLVRLPSLVAIAPLALPPGRSGELPVGAQVTVSLDGLLAPLR